MGESATSQRDRVEIRLKGLAQCYMRGLKMSATASRKTRDDTAPYKQEFLVYSPLGEKGLVKSSADGSVEFGYVPPFWAVMLTDRDDQQLVNMNPYQEEFRLNHPTPVMFAMKFNVNIQPFTYKVFFFFLSHNFFL